MWTVRYEVRKKATPGPPFNPLGARLLPQARSKLGVAGSSRGTGIAIEKTGAAEQVRDYDTNGRGASGARGGAGDATRGRR